MDEHREDREELDALARDDADDAREQEAARIYWTEPERTEPVSDERREYEAVVYVQLQTTEEDAWPCLKRSGIFVGELIGETLVTDIELDDDTP